MKQISCIYFFLIFTFVQIYDTPQNVAYFSEDHFGNFSCLVFR